MTDYRDFLNNPRYKVTIVGLTGGSISAVMQNDLAIAGGNDFTTVGDIVSEIPIAGNIKNLKDKASGLVKVTGRSVISELETRLVWSNSLKPNLNIEMTFYNDEARSNSDPKSAIYQYKAIKSAVLPTKQGSFFKAPLGYKVASLNSKKKVVSGSPSGVLAIEIGGWFRASNMVMTSESFQMSKEVNSLGQPLFITGSITLEPFRAITFEEFEDYFIETNFG